MPKKNEEERTEPVAPVEEVVEGVRLVTIVYSQGRDLYRVPSLVKPVWLSVKVYPLPAITLAADAISCGPALTADGKAWRKSYATTWKAVVNGDHATLPADDPMVLDYAAFTPSAR